MDKIVEKIESVVRGQRDGEERAREWGPDAEIHDLSLVKLRSLSRVVRAMTEGYFEL